MDHSQRSSLQPCLSTAWLLCVLVVFLPLLSLGTVICQQCHPVAVQEAPGVGISLGFDQIAVAVQFCNGTVVNAEHKIVTEDYIHATTRLHDLANFTSSKKLANAAKNMILASKPAVKRSPDLAAILHETRQNAAEFTRESIATDMILLADKMRSIFEEVATANKISERHMFITLPDSLFHSNIVGDLTTSLLHVSALTSYESASSQSRSASLDLYSLWNCLDDDEIPGDYGDCERYQGRRINQVLHIELSENYFATGVLQRDQGWLFEDDLKARSYLNQGTLLSKSSMGSKYWKWLREQLQQLSSGLGGQVDLVVLLGTGTTDPSFRQVIEDMFRDNPDAVPPMKTAEDYTFAAARHAARAAKSVLWDGRGGCLPSPQCPMSKFMPEGRRWRDIEDVQAIVKSEL